MADRKPFLLRIDRDVLESLQRWADDDLRSLNGQIEFVLRRALDGAGRGEGGQGWRGRQGGPLAFAQDGQGGKGERDRRRLTTPASRPTSNRHMESLLADLRYGLRLMRRSPVLP